MSNAACRIVFTFYCFLNFLITTLSLQRSLFYAQKKPSNSCEAHTTCMRMRVCIEHRATRKCNSARRAIQCSCFTFNVNIRYNCVFSVNSCLHLWAVRGDRRWWWLKWKKHECVLHFMLPTVRVLVCASESATNRKVSFMSFIRTCIDWKVHTHSALRS